MLKEKIVQMEIAFDMLTQRQIRKVQTKEDHQVCLLFSF